MQGFVVSGLPPLMAYDAAHRRHIELQRRPSPPSFSYSTFKDEGINNFTSKQHFLPEMNGKQTYSVAPITTVLSTPQMAYLYESYKPSLITEGVADQKLGNYCKTMLKSFPSMTPLTDMLSSATRNVSSYRGPLIATPKHDQKPASSCQNVTRNGSETNSFVPRRPSISYAVADISSVSDARLPSAFALSPLSQGCTTPSTSARLEQTNLIVSNMQNIAVGKESIYTDNMKLNVALPKENNYTDHKIKHSNISTDRIIGSSFVNDANRCGLNKAPVSLIAQVANTVGKVVANEKHRVNTPIKRRQNVAKRHTIHGITDKLTKVAVSGPLPGTSTAPDFLSPRSTTDGQCSHIKKHNIRPSEQCDVLPLRCNKAPATVNSAFDVSSEVVHGVVAGRRSEVLYKKGAFTGPVTYHPSANVHELAYASGNVNVNTQKIGIMCDNQSARKSKECGDGFNVIPRGRGFADNSQTAHQIVQSRSPSRNPSIGKIRLVNKQSVELKEAALLSQISSQFHSTELPNKTTIALGLRGVRIPALQALPGGANAFTCVISIKPSGIDAASEDISLSTLSNISIVIPLPMHTSDCTITFKLYDSTSTEVATGEMVLNSVEFFKSFVGAVRLRNKKDEIGEILVSIDNPKN